MVFEPFWPEIGYRFELFWSKSLKNCMDFTETGLDSITRSENGYGFLRQGLELSQGLENRAAQNSEEYLPRLLLSPM